MKLTKKPPVHPFSTAQRTGRNFIIKDGLSGIEIAGLPGANDHHDHEETPVMDGIMTNTLAMASDGIMTNTLAMTSVRIN